jgi:hypothetical protein
MNASLKGFNPKEIKMCASEIIKAGAALYDALGQEPELREHRARAVAGHVDTDFVERSIKEAIAMVGQRRSKEGWGPPGSAGRRGSRAASAIRHDWGPAARHANHKESGALPQGPAWDWTKRGAASTDDWAWEVYDGVPYGQAGRGVRAEVDGRVQHGGRGRAGSISSPPHRLCAGTVHGRLTAALAVGGGGGARGGVWTCGGGG